MRIVARTRKLVSGSPDSDSAEGGGEATRTSPRRKGHGAGSSRKPPTPPLLPLREAAVQKHHAAVAQHEAAVAAMQGAYGATVTKHEAVVAAMQGGGISRQPPLRLPLRQAAVTHHEAAVVAMQGAVV